MPAPSPSVARNFRYSSDYSIDKIIWRSSGVQNIPQAGSMSDTRSFVVPHGLGFRPLVRCIFSDDDFVTTWEPGNDPVFLNPLFASYTIRIGVQASSDATNVYLTFINFQSARNIKYKLVGLAPTDIPSTDNYRTANGEGDFYFSTDFNYLKLLDSGKEQLTIPIFADATWTKTHSLGYRPITLTWTEFNGRTWQVGTENTIGVGGLYSESWVTDSALAVKCYSGGEVSTYIHYRTYIDS